MTPKEKAEQLVEQFNCGGLETFAGHNVKVISKQCALIAVDETIKATTPLTSTYFWQEVKTEIEKL